MARRPFDAGELSRALRALIDALPERKVDLAGVAASPVSQLRADILTAIDRLTALSVDLDPVTQPPVIFNPADPETVGALIAKTLLEQPRTPLAAAGKFYGSGVYAIYYRGGFPAYAPIRGKDTPIYVGKADPRKPGANTPEEQGLTLSRRLADHMRSITLATNLHLEDFDCRYLVVRSAWQATAETYLINRFKPIWNSEVNICFGFGKHGDDPKTRGNKRSPWDTVHPGRPWAEKSPPYDLSVEKILGKIAEHYTAHPPAE